MTGSPPHVRGKVLTIPVVVLHHGITPACAGKRTTAPVQRLHGWDHPRMCGEKFDDNGIPMLYVGSPPHVRGKALCLGSLHKTDGITPACAGKSEWEACHTPRRRDHPRMCGEKAKGPSKKELGRGSPPHVRGKGQTGGPDPGVGGITPACAGKSRQAGVEHGVPRDHPRMCGEKIPENSMLFLGGGSPPHVRGKAMAEFGEILSPGITPACAGKREGNDHGGRSGGDHPRMCGEKPAPSNHPVPSGGSPPHVRGKGEAFLVMCAGTGITPACAGKRTGSVHDRLSVRDHPRMCGEKLVEGVQDAVEWGSPPHVRGKVSGLVFCRPPSGITPACAGKRLT